MNRKFPFQPQGRVYRCLMAILFGWIGFAVNFLNIQLLDSPHFKINILLGLLFPLFIAVAWGARFGLLSALVGGTQTMWYLWYSDGYGFLYSVPIFTLWILWHGYWEDRRQQNPTIWWQNIYVIEIPFRIFMSIGFFVIFRWLVSLNPPVWDPQITWNFVSIDWVVKVVIKQTITGYVLLLATQVLLELPPIRRLVGFPLHLGERQSSFFISVALLTGVIVWALDSAIDFLLFNPTQQTFWEIFALHVSPHDFFMRSLLILILFVLAMVFSKLFRQREELRLRTLHLNNVLRGIRNVNQLITHEKSISTLLSEACSFLIDSRGYQSVWIAHWNEHQQLETIYQAGLQPPLFQELKALLEQGVFPRCYRIAQTQPQPFVEPSPEMVCTSCPLGQSYQGNAVITIRLEHQGQVFGILSASIPKHFVHDDEEHSLLKEVAGDLAFALYSIQNEKEKQAAAEALRQSNEQLQLALEGADLGTWDWDILSGKIYFNERWAEMLGYSMDEVTNDLSMWSDRLHPNDQEKIMAKLQDHLDGKTEFYESEHRLQHKSGRWIWVLDKGKVIERNSQGQAIRVCGTHLDVTSRKEAEEKLRTSEEKYRVLAETAQDIICIHDLNGNIQYLNQAGLRFLDLTTEQVFQRKVTDFVSKEEFNLMQKRQKRREQGDPSRFLFRTTLLNDAGQKLPVEVASALLNPNRKEQGVLLWARDITERLRSFEELQNREAFLKRVVESSASSICFLDLQGIILFMNQVGQNLLQVNNPELIVHKPWIELWPAEHQVLASEALLKAQQGKRGNFQGFSLDFAQKPHWWDVTVNPIVNTQDTFDQLLVIARDITEKKNTEDQLRHAQKMESVGRLAGGIAHDFNNMLGGIMGSADILEKHLHQNETLFPYVEIIQDAAGKAASLTKKLLDFSRKGKLESTPINLHHIIHSTIHLLERSIDKNIQLVPQLEAEQSNVIGDPAQLQNALLNLAVNARDAMPDGGTLLFSTENISLDTSFCSQSSFDVFPGDYVKICVQDSGKGIPPEIQTNIFEPFFTTKDVGEGTGLGLSAVYGTIKDHLGLIDFESKLGQGTTFSLYLPVHNEQFYEPGPTLPIYHTQQQGTLLIIDDEKVIRNMAKGMLEELGYTVITAEDGPSGLHIYQERQTEIDLVLLDMVMPKMSGRKVFEKLQAINPQIKVVFSSGFSSQKGFRELLEKGAQGFIHKPYRIHELSQILNQILQEKEPKES